ncbi:MAG: hypothetical protein IMZ69_06875 [Spirochaetes bacterium]|nr:hypothetical protein [Spirochaetota bacterium]
MGGPIVQRLENVIRIGVVKGLAAVDAQGQPTLLGVGAPKNSKSGKARLLQVQIGPQLKTVQLVPLAGEDFSPPDGSRLAILEMGGWLLAVASQDDVPPDPNLNRGEKLLYASDGAGAKRGRLKFKGNGKVYLGNATGNLRAPLDDLLTALNTFSGPAAQSAITAGGSSAAALAAAIVALMNPLYTAAVNCKTAIDAVLDMSE